MLAGRSVKKTALIQMLFSDRSGEPIKSAERAEETGAWARFVPMKIIDPDIHMVSRTTTTIWRWP